VWCGVPEKGLEGAQERMPEKVESVSRVPPKTTSITSKIKESFYDIFLGIVLRGIFC